MTTRLIAYGATLTGVFTLTTISLVEDHPRSARGFLPTFAALAFVVLILAAEWRPRRGRS